MCIAESPAGIPISRLLDIRPRLIAYLRERGLRRNSIRSYVNFIRILLQKARDLGWVDYPSGLTEAWQPVINAVSTVRGCKGIIHYALRLGRTPHEFSDSDLSLWRELELKHGRRDTYIRHLEAQFRQRIVGEGLSPAFPNLLASKNREAYSIPVSDFPEPLRTQTSALLDWKTARYSQGRPNRAKHRPISAKQLEGYLRRLFGFASSVRQRTVSNLQELLSRENVSDYVEWALNQRKLSARTLSLLLGMIRALRIFPPLKELDFDWIVELASQLPTDFENLTKDTKDRKWVAYDVLAQVPKWIRKEAGKNLHLNKNVEALPYRNALLIEWLTILPWRQRNIRECRVMPSALGGNLFKEELPQNSPIAKPKWVEEAFHLNPHDTFWQFYFRPEETKNGRAVRALIPRQLISPLETYLRDYRPWLVSGSDPHRLFLSFRGRTLTAGALGSLVGEIMLKHTGKPVNPHLFRDIFAVKWLEENPEDYLTLSKILWHSSVETTLGIYGKNFNESHGARRVEEWLDKREVNSSQEENP